MRVREVGVREMGVREGGVREMGVREVGVREMGVRESIPLISVPVRDRESVTPDTESSTRSSEVTSSNQLIKRHISQKHT